ncbi:2-hydroxyacid dehydrogenase [Enterobacteriaceae bacterium H20N1]|uniref:2-hydroxyacid dehydrogenase n=1 Tax=Dryocola boscaweniae TaxID=2925397 RepID=A0A9X3AMK1_9ENTR|nr:2-hydroxyacid dehydrogenase [Dryocola boscaweniae]MCT4700686.1 2-hydroxyacid dehydrogenase [Dryocola boscaweniae]MCT4716168.1 2-hydroxyacid dehydrogenase [Dryocola boscaweniae]MCT4717900.1 2-hydroxyacid dehydrogenase [Dryocola boscaweniae]
MSQPAQHVLLIAPVMDALQQRLDAQYSVHRLYQQPDAAAWLAENGKQIGAVVTRGDIGVTTAVLENLPQVGVIAIFGVGTDAVDLEYARRREIAVTITAGALTDDVADLAFGLLLSSARKLCLGDRFVREGRWLQESLPLATQVSRKRIGIFGMGNIGRAIARRAAGFDMEIYYTDRKADAALPYQWCEDVLSLAENSDFFIVAVSGGKESLGIVNRQVFQALPGHALVINIARGSIINEQDLIAALQNGDIAGAGLDVFAQEPQVPAEFIAMDNVVLQPHVASATHETRQRMSNIVFENVEAYFNHKHLPHRIN